MVSIECPVLGTAGNFRDVAGPGYPVPGGRMRQGVLYRSNRLGLSDEDVAALSGLRISAVHDLRETYEIERHPNVELSGARALSHVVPGIPPDAMRGLTSVEETDAAMREHYRGFVSEEGRRSGFAAALGAIVKGLREGNRPQVFHCSAGKDRTGWLAAVIQTAVGVSWDDVVVDFLLTDERWADGRTESLALVEAALGPELAAILEPAFRCSVEQLEEARAEAQRVYGGIEEYVASGLGLDADDRAFLVDRLVVPD